MRARKSRAIIFGGLTIALGCQLVGTSLASTHEGFFEHLKLLFSHSDKKGSKHQVDAPKARAANVHSIIHYIPQHTPYPPKERLMLITHANSELDESQHVLGLMPNYSDVMPGTQMADYSFTNYEHPMPVTSILNLPQAIKYTLASNPDVLAAEANQRAEGHALTQTKAAFLPKIDLLISTGRERTHTRAIESVMQQRWQRQLTLTQLIFDGWGTPSRIHKGEYDLAAAKTLTVEQKQAVSLLTINGYLDVIRFKRLVGLAKHNIVVHQRTLRRVTKMYQSGAGNIADVALAKSRLSLAIAILASGKRFYGNSLANFEAIVGTMPGKLRMPAYGRIPTPNSIRRAIEVGLIHNPLMKASKQRYTASRYNITATRSRYYPNVSLELRGTEDNNVDGIEGINQERQALLVVRYNLFNGGADMAGMHNAQEQANIAAQTIYKSQRRVRKEVIDAWNNLVAAKKRYRQQQVRVTNTRDVVNAYQKQFTLGKRNLLNLLDTERELFNARSDLVNAQFDVITDSYALQAAMGKLLNHVT